MHPRLCVGGGEEFLKVLLSGGETEKLYIAACYPQMQCILFRDAFDTVGFDRTKHIALDIRYKTTEEALEEIKKQVNTNPERDSRERVAQGSSPRELNQGKASYLCTEDSQPQRQNLASY